MALWGGLLLTSPALPRDARPPTGAAHLIWRWRRVGTWLPLRYSALPPQVQDAVKCRVVDRQEEGNGDSGGSFQNGHAQLMVGLRARGLRLPHLPRTPAECLQALAVPQAPLGPSSPAERSSEPSVQLGKLTLAKWNPWSGVSSWEGLS